MILQFFKRTHIPNFPKRLAIILTIFTTAIIASHFFMVRSEGAKLARSFLLNNIQVRERLGDNLEANLAFNKSTLRDTGDNGEAHYVFNVKGSNAKVPANVWAIKRNNKWSIVKGNFELPYGIVIEFVELDASKKYIAFEEIKNHSLPITEPLGGSFAVGVAILKKANPAAEALEAFQKEHTVFLTIRNGLVPGVELTKSQTLHAKPNIKFFGIPKTTDVIYDNDYFFTTIRFAKSFNCKMLELSNLSEFKNDCEESKGEADGR